MKLPFSPKAYMNKRDRSLLACSHLFAIHQDKLMDHLHLKIMDKVMKVNKRKLKKIFES